jgi:hypothetical protein
MRPKLDSLHLCRTAIADNKAVRTERVITEDVLSERFSRTLGVRALFLGEEAVIPQVCCEQLSLARKLATGFSVQTFNGKLIYHMPDDWVAWRHVLRREYRAIYGTMGRCLEGRADAVTAEAMCASSTRSWLYEGHAEGM